MIFNQWVIAQLISGFAAVLLLLYTSVLAVEVIRKWDAGASSEYQIGLERKSYLAGALLQFVLIAELLSFVLFIFTVNTEVPAVIRGAMCASGALRSNEWGNYLLWLRISGLLVYFSFLVANHYDSRTPNSALTPKKYYFIFPAFFWSALSFACNIQYFSAINPDVITTCCSVKFSDTSASLFDSAISSFEGLQWVFVAVFVLILLLRWFGRLKGMIALITVWSYVLIGSWSLKEYFVKYIYGLPSHRCLYDTFLPKYYYVGYLIFGLYAFLAFSALALCLRTYWRMRVPQAYARDISLLQQYILFSATLVMLIQWAYVIAWQGEL